MIENIAVYLSTLFWSGWTSLLDYLAAHVLLCLVPAFVIAGYVSAMIPKEVITRYLGPKAPRWISYPAAAIGGFILAVCSSLRKTLSNLRSPIGRRDFRLRCVEVCRCPGHKDRSAFRSVGERPSPADEGRCIVGV